MDGVTKDKSCVGRTDVNLHFPRWRDRYCDELLLAGLKLLASSREASRILELASHTGEQGDDGKSGWMEVDDEGGNMKPGGMKGGRKGGRGGKESSGDEEQRAKS